MAASPVARALVPPFVRRGEGFGAWRIDGALLGREADPFLNVDHFRMSAPTFPPHAHAGFSAVTYILPTSAGAMRNRDGRGDRSLIRPGGLHWTAAGAGLIHEEVPEPDGIVVEGMQIFVRQPVAQERAKPAVHHLEPEQVSVLEIGPGSWVRVLAGSFAGHEAGFDAPSPLQLLDIALAPGDGLEWRNPWSQGGAVVYVFDGAVKIEGEAAEAPRLLAFPRGTPALQIAAPIGDARMLLLAGAPLDAPNVSNGPFVLSSPAALERAIALYRAGGMGRIED